LKVRAYVIAGAHVTAGFGAVIGIMRELKIAAASDSLPDGSRQYNIIIKSFF
jgi:hypothetical protein